MHRDDERVLGKIGEINGRLLERGRRAEETDIDFSVRDCRYLLLRRHLAKGYRHERITHPKGTDGLGKEARKRASGREPDTEVYRFAGRHRVNLLTGVFQFSNHRRRMTSDSRDRTTYLEGARLLIAVGLE